MWCRQSSIASSSQVGKAGVVVLLGSAHSTDVCGKMSTESLGGGQYILTFIVDKTLYIWVYVVKHKNEVLKKFLQWKAMTEKSGGRRRKTPRTDNGGEYTSIQFSNYLNEKGIRYKLTVPKTPQQKGDA